LSQQIIQQNFTFIFLFYDQLCKTHYLRLRDVKTKDRLSRVRLLGSARDHRRQVS